MATANGLNEMAAHGKEPARFRIRRIYDPASPEDGARVLVDRLWPRGIGKDAAALDLWLKEIAPSAPLRRWFGHEPARWAEFARRYRAELDANPQAVARLRQVAAHGPVTLLYAAHDILNNHARVLAAYMGAPQGTPDDPA